ncbi:MAG: alkaline phosphatase family protein [Rhodospirillaceae bacterium]
MADRIGRGLALFGLLLAITAGGAAAAAVPLAGIDHIVVIYLENRSFDSMFGLFPGADGLANAGAAARQLDKAGTPYVTLPPVLDLGRKPVAADPRFPADLPNRPFDIGAFVPLDHKTSDLVHRFYTNQEQINGGKNDKFVAWSDAGALSFGYYDTSSTVQWRLARDYVLADAFFQAAFGGSFLNHFWLVCACTPVFPDAPPALRATFDDQGRLIRDGAVTPDGFAVNTLHSVQQPHSPSVPASALLPAQTAPTIGDRLSEKGISWAWYSGGWNNALAGTPDADFQFHHQPLAAFRKFGDGTPARAEHLKDFVDLEQAIAAGALPQVVFYKPVGALNQHPGYSEIASADGHLAALMAKLEQSPQWPRTAVIITSDENGGFWDHVAPPRGDRWGPGTRIPAIIVSPQAKRHFVDHTLYDTTSILATIERRFGLQPLAERDAKAHDLGNAFVE